MSWMDEAAYRREYARSLADPDGFWAEQAERLGTAESQNMHQAETT